MADPFVVVSIDGLEEVKAKLDKLPGAVADAGTDEANEYLLNVLKTYPGYKYVSRKSAYGSSFFTARQRRWFFASLADGSLRIPYKRTQNLRNAWKLEGSGKFSFISNESTYASLVMGDGQQSRHMQKIGWKVVGAVLKERAATILKKFEVGVNKAIRKLGLQ